MTTPAETSRRLAEQFAREQQKWLETEVIAELHRCNFITIWNTARPPFRPLWDALFYLGWRCVRTDGSTRLYAPSGRLIASRALNPWRPS